MKSIVCNRKNALTPNALWSEAYDEIFAGQRVEPHVLAVLFVQQTQEWITLNEYTSVEDDLRRKLVKNGVYHLARIVAFMWRQTDKWGQSESELREQISRVKSDPSTLNAELNGALEFCEQLIRDNKAFSYDVDAALKSTLLEREITRELHAE